MMNALATAGVLADKVTFATMNVFGRNLNGIAKVDRPRRPRPLRQPQRHGPDRQEREAGRLRRRHPQRHQRRVRGRRHRFGDRRAGDRRRHHRGQDPRRRRRAPWARRWASPTPWSRATTSPRPAARSSPPRSQKRPPSPRAWPGGKVTGARRARAPLSCAHALRRLADLVDRRGDSRLLRRRTEPQVRLHPARGKRRRRTRRSPSVRDRRLRGEPGLLLQEVPRAGAVHQPG